MILQIHSSDDAWLRAAVNCIVSAQGDAQSLHLCLAGGTTPRPVYEKLARTEAFRTIVASKAVHLWVGDEREAPAHSGLRNSEMIAEIFAAAGFGFKNVAFREAGAALSTLPASAQPTSLRRQGEAGDPSGLFLHPWPTGPRDRAAALYEEDILAYAREAEAVGRPWFDLVVLGMGQDGRERGPAANGVHVQAVHAVGHVAAAGHGGPGHLFGDDKFEHGHPGGPTETQRRMDALDGIHAVLFLIVSV